MRLVHFAFAALLASLIEGLTSCSNTLAAVLSQNCPTASQFCSALLSSTPLLQLVTYTEKQSYYNTRIKTGKTTTTVIFPSKTSTITASPTITAQVGLSTTTVNQCQTLATCGAVTTPPQGSLRAACSCLLATSSTSTIVYYRGQARPFTYRHTSRITYDYTTTISTTVYPAVTQTVPVQTVYNCPTVSAPAQTCNNSLHQFAFWNLTKQDQSNPPSQWDLDYYKTALPAYNGTAGLIGLIGYDYSSGYPIPQDKYPATCKNDFYINDRAYLYAPQTGTYTFNILAYAQAVYFWIGDVAYSGYNVSNAFISATAPGHGYGGGPSKQIDLVKGTYYPIRSAYRCNATVDFDYYMSIIRPDGQYLFGEYQTSTVRKYGYYLYYGYRYNSFGVQSNYIVQFGCGADKKLAPPYPLWGSET